jgi:DNA-binding response OmpR family regulator
MQKEKKHLYSVLFIEDEKAIRDNYTSYLKHHFEKVYEAKDGLSAYEVYKEKKPDILIVDIHIPYMNGIELLKKIRENDHTTKAIMLTAHAETDYLLQAAELKLTKYLVKPISRQELKEALNLVIHELSDYKVSSNKVTLLSNNYIWDHTKEEFIHNGNSIKLTSLERKTVTLFFNNPNIILSFENIIYEVWSDSKYGSHSSLKTIIKNLRKKIPLDIIKNIFGVGYKLEV